MPTLTLSITALRRANACDLDERIADLRTVRPDVADDEPVPLAVWWGLATTSIPDRWWSLRAAAPADTARQVAVRVAALAARRVLYLTRDSDRAACDAAIVAADAWADQPTAAADAASRAAYAAAAGAGASRAAYAAYAADAAAYAAYAADAAAGAAYAAYAADAAAYAAAAAAGAASRAAYAADAAARADAAAAADSERNAQRADLDRLIMETSR